MSGGPSHIRGGAPRANLGGGAAERKGAIRDALARLGTVAETAGLASTARDIREVRIPKLEEERFSVVVLGEFNHGKSTFINALLGGAVLPVGITPTTAALAQIRHGEQISAEAVLESGERRPIDPARLADWLTVEGGAAAAAGSPLSYIDLRHPAAFLRDNVTVVDTPGVNDINEQRAEITYGYVPRADAALFLLDATQILSASERRFLEERILRSSRDRLVFVVTKADLLDPDELEQALSFARQHLADIVPVPTVFAVSAKKALAGDAAAGRMEPLLGHLRLTLGAERRRLLLDHALADAARLSGFVRQSLAMRQRSLELPPEDLQARVTRAQQKLHEGRRALDDAAESIQAETAALKARVRQDLAAFTEELCGVLPREIELVPAGDVQKYLAPFLEDTWKSWLEEEGTMVAEELERIAERAIEVANERAEGLTRNVGEDLGGGKLVLDVDTFKYDASVFAIGALGTTVFLFVNTVAGGLLTMAAPIVALVMKGRMAAEAKREAQERAPAAVRQVAAALGPKLDDLIDGFSHRLKEFIAEAGQALARGIAEVLDRALVERRQHSEAVSTGVEAGSLEEALKSLRGVDERIAEIRQAVWDAE